MQEQFFKKNIPVKSQASRYYSRYLAELELEIMRASKPDTETVVSRALYQAKQVLTQLKKQQEITDDLLLLRLADICSHITQGLHFLVNDQQPFSCHIFCVTDDCSGEVKQVIYNTDTHKNNMKHLQSMVHFLEKSSWVNCKKKLLGFAAAIIIIGTVILFFACLLAISPLSSLIPIAPFILLWSWTIFPACCILVGLASFVGHYTGLAGAVDDVSMPTQISDHRDFSDDFDLALDFD